MALPCNLEEGNICTKALRLPPLEAQPRGAFRYMGFIGEPWRSTQEKGREGSRTEKAERGSARTWSQLESSLGLMESSLSLIRREL